VEFLQAFFLCKGQPTCSDLAAGTPWASYKLVMRGCCSWLEETDALYQNDS